jgi:hypothetical protein
VPLAQWLQGPSSGFKNRLVVLIHSYQVEKLQRDQAIREQQSGAESKGQEESLPSSIASLSAGSSGSSVHSGLAPSSGLEFPSQSNPLASSGSFSKSGHEQVTAPWFPDAQDPNKSSLESAHSPVPIPNRNWYDDITTPWSQNVEQPSYPWSSIPIGQPTAWNLSADKPPNVILQEQTKVLTEIVEKMKDKPASKNTRKKKKTKGPKAKEPKADPQNQKNPSPSTSQKGSTTTPAPTVNNANTAVTNTNVPKSNPKAPSTTQQQSQQHQKSPPQVKKTKPQYKLKQAPEPPEEQPKPVEQPAIKKSSKYGKKPQVWKVVEKKEEENVEITEGQDSSLHNTEEKI